MLGLIRVRYLIWVNVLARFVLIWAPNLKWAKCFVTWLVQTYIQRTTRLTRTILSGQHGKSGDKKRQYVTMAAESVNTTLRKLKLDFGIHITNIGNKSIFNPFRLGRHITNHNFRYINGMLPVHIMCITHSHYRTSPFAPFWYTNKQPPRSVRRQYKHGCDGDTKRCTDPDESVVCLRCSH